MFLKFIWFKKQNIRNVLLDKILNLGHCDRILFNIMVYIWMSPKDHRHSQAGILAGDWILGAWSGSPAAAPLSVSWPPWRAQLSSTLDLPPCWFCAWAQDSEAVSQNGPSSWEFCVPGTGYRVSVTDSDQDKWTGTQMMISVRESYHTTVTACILNTARKNTSS